MYDLWTEEPTQAEIAAMHAACAFDYRVETAIRLHPALNVLAQGYYQAVQDYDAAKLAAYASLDNRMEKVRAARTTTVAWAEQCTTAAEWKEVSRLEKRMNRLKDGLVLEIERVERCHRRVAA